MFFASLMDAVRPARKEDLGHVIWLLAEDGALATLGAHIEPYGYSVLRFDPREGVPADAALPEPEMVLVDAHPEERPITTQVGDAAALAGRPGVVVIDHGLDEIDRILALEAGADDCVSWPCPPREFIARMRAIARRVRPAAAASAASTSEADSGDVLHFGSWTLDRRHRRLTAPDRAAENLSAAEFAVLDHLAHHPRRTVTRETLLEATAPVDGEETRTLRTVDIQVSRLRKRLAVDGDEIIRTVRGQGYMLIASVTSD